MPQVRGRNAGDFHDDFMECSGHHYQSLIKPDLPAYPFKASTSRTSYSHARRRFSKSNPCYDQAPLSQTGLPTFGMFFENYFSIPLRSHGPKFVPRADVISKLVLALPRIDELAFEMGHNLNYYRLDVDAYIEQRVK
jgi:hypothetical protein